MSDLPVGTRLSPLVAFPNLVLGQVDDHGVEWIVAGIEGWDSPATVGETTQRFSADGASVGQWFRAARTVTITGRAGADSEADAELAEDRLFAAVGADDRLMTVTRRLQARQAEVRQNGQIVVVPVNELAFDFTLSLLAPDPARYSTAEHLSETGLPSTVGGLAVPATLATTIASTATSGTLLLSNAGTVETWPVYTIEGPAVRPRVGVQGAESWWLAHTLSADDVAVVDTRSGEVFLNGASRTDLLRGTPEPLWPGDTELLFTAAAFNGGSRLRAVWRDAWT